MQLVERLYEEREIVSSPVARELAAVMTRPVGQTSAGYPYLEPSAWTRFRDWVPHLLSHGPRVLEAARLVEQKAKAHASSAEEHEAVKAAEKVIRQVALTAAITAPSDLWLLRFVVSTLHEVGVATALLDGEPVTAARAGLDERELSVDLGFLLARGYLTRSGRAFRLATHRHARALLQELSPLDEDDHVRLSALWTRALGGAPLSDDELRVLASQRERLPPSDEVREPGLWMATPAEVEIGFRLVPLVVGLQASSTGARLLHDEGDVSSLCPGSPEASEAARAVLAAAGLLDEDGRLGVIGRRVVERGPGPMGIIEAYHPYLARLSRVLREGRGKVWVERSANVAASQVANQKTFRMANDALDAFCEKTGFAYSVFIEHALGRGEATRQRFERSGAASLRYVGADLEDDAIAAAKEERRAGRLPSDMLFVPRADIGRPETLLDALASSGLETDGAVMLVGNGFHEVRDRSDERMREVFAGYCAAGIVLIFTEETALFAEDLLETAWNTYHAGFKYVHERSGQGLRPAVPRPPSSLDATLPASWSECAESAGYVRAHEFCVKSRTVYPYPPPSGHNPSISVTHFFVPRALAKRLGLEDVESDG